MMLSVPACAGLARAGHRGVREAQARFGKKAADFTRIGHAGGAEIDDDGPRLRGAGNAVLAKADLMHLLAARQRKEDHIRRRRDFGDRGGRLGAVLDQFLKRCRVHVEGVQRGRVLDDDVMAHRAAHDAKTDKADHGILHDFVSSLSNIRTNRIVRSDKLARQNNRFVSGFCAVGGQ